MVCLESLSWDEKISVIMVVCWGSAFAKVKSHLQKKVWHNRSLIYPVARKLSSFFSSSHKGREPFCVENEEIRWDKVPLADTLIGEKDLDGTPLMRKEQEIECRQFIIRDKNFNVNHMLYIRLKIVPFNLVKNLAHV